MAESTASMNGESGHVAPGDDGGARHLVSGLELPDITLASSRGGGVNLSKRKGGAIVYVYPWTGRPGVENPPGWDDIPGAHGSTPETEGFRDLYLRFRAQRMEVFGLSTQDSEHHREMASRLAVPFAFLSDDEFEMQKALGLPTFEAGGVRYLKRLTLLVRDGHIAHTFYPVADPARHAKEVIDWLDEKRRAFGSAG
ncbi:MAG TPA: peroxiredoxin [Hyphomicrobium sp.]|nr:peroxiredoxin [Hyphomicrobium sp.]